MLLQRMVAVLASVCAGCTVEASAPWTMMVSVAPAGTSMFPASGPPASMLSTPPESWKSAATGALPKPLVETLAMLSPVSAAGSVSLR